MCLTRAGETKKPTWIWPGLYEERRDRANAVKMYQSLPACDRTAEAMYHLAAS